MTKYKFEEEFDKVFSGEMWFGKPEYDTADRQDALDFFRSQIQACLEEMEGMKKNRKYASGYDLALSEAQDIIRKRFL